MKFSRIILTSVLFGLMLTALTIYTVLDAFVIERVVDITPITKAPDTTGKFVEVMSDEKANEYSSLIKSYYAMEKTDLIESLIESLNVQSVEKILSLLDGDIKVFVAGIKGTVPAASTDNISDSVPVTSSVAAPVTTPVTTPATSAPEPTNEEIYASLIEGYSKSNNTGLLKIVLDNITDEELKLTRTYLSEDAQKFLDDYIESTKIVYPIITDTSYEDENIKIGITKLTRYKTTCYVVDIQLSDIEYLKAAFARNKYGDGLKDETSDMAKNKNAILAFNGDYYGYRYPYGFVLRNGKLYQSRARKTSSDDDALVIYDDGRFEMVEENKSNAKELLNNGAWQIFSFGPGLIKDGKVIVSKSSEVAQSSTSNPRTAIGMIEPLHYVVLVSEGRIKSSDGLTLYECASILDTYGCKQAYNLDGGSSTTLYFNGKVLNTLTSDEERRVSDIVYIGY